MRTKELRGHLLVMTLAAFSLVVASPLLAADADSESTQASAECEVRVLNASPAAVSMEAPATLLMATAVDDPLDDYVPQKNSGGDNDASTQPLRLVLEGPRRRRIIDIDVTIDGVDFRSAHRQWIDTVVQHAQQTGDVPAADIASNSEVDLRTPTAHSDASESPLTSIQARTRAEPSLRDRVLTYIRAVSGEIDREEVYWLLDRWPAGAAVTLLGPSRSWQRAGVAPLYELLDSDADGSLSSAEISGAIEQLQKADIDEDGLLQLAEIQKRIESQGGSRQWRVAEKRSPLIRIADPSEQSGADLELQVAFTDDGGSVRATSMSRTPPVIGSHGDVISIGYEPEYLEVVAVQTGSSPDESPDASQTDEPTQLSVGVVIDGYPLWRRLDQDGDRRLAARERRELPTLLAGIDRNSDGVIEPDEIPTAIRLAIGRGPLVHRPLESPTPAVGQSIKASQAAAPDWFRSMDRNQDGELSRDEFAGTREQFSALDTSGDGFLSTDEANASSN